MQSFFRSFFTVSFYTFLSRILGFVRDILIARFLGSTVTADAFFVAWRIPNFFRRVLAEGAYSAALIPVFSGIVIDSKDDHEAADFVENTMSLLLFVTVGLTIIFFFGMPYIIQLLAPGFSANNEAFDLAVHFGKIIFPYLINFVGVVYLIPSVLLTVYYCYICYELMNFKKNKFDPKQAKKVFTYSIFYLFFIFVLFLLDNLI